MYENLSQEAAACINQLVSASAWHCVIIKQMCVITFIIAYVLFNTGWVHWMTVLPARQTWL